MSLPSDRRRKLAAAGAATAAAVAAAVAGRRLAGDGGGPDRAYRLLPGEGEAEGIRRVAKGRLENATEALRDPAEDPVEAVHTARKDAKKVRAVLKLVRPALGEEVYRAENERVRDAARILSQVRDAQVRGETVDALARRFEREPPAGGWARVREALAGGAPGATEVDALRRRAAAELDAVKDDVDRWPLAENGFDALRPGLRRAYSRARKRHRGAREKPTDERLHEYRKRSKDLWYHLRLLAGRVDGALDPAERQVHELSDRLGDDHDLAVLHSDVAGDERLDADQRDHLLALIGRRRAELQGEAFELGDSLLGRKPKQFTKQVERSWSEGGG